MGALINLIKPIDKRSKKGYNNNVRSTGNGRLPPVVKKITAQLGRQGRLSFFILQIGKHADNENRDIYQIPPGYILHRITSLLSKEGKKIVTSSELEGSEPPPYGTPYGRTQKANAKEHYITVSDVCQELKEKAANPEGKAAELFDLVTKQIFHCGFKSFSKFINHVGGGSSEGPVSLFISLDRFNRYFGAFTKLFLAHVFL